MTQEEVDLIYDYLHENYEYMNGELIRKKNSRTKKIGEKIGCFSFVDNKKPKTSVTLNFKKNRFRVLLPNLIFLYHYKEYPFTVHYLDNNPVNYNIDNLIKGTRETIKKNKKVKKPYKIENGNYKTFIRFNYKTYHLGVFEKEENAYQAYEIANINLIKNKLLTGIELRKIIENIIGDKTTKIKNESLIKGYSIKRWKDTITYQVRVSVNNKKITVGTFKTPEEAHAAYLKAKKELTLK